MVTSHHTSKMYWISLICLIAIAILTEGKKPFLSKIVAHVMTTTGKEYRMWQCGQKTIVEVCE